jgi:predicted alpha/beta superfamily hydrolase
VEEFILRGNSLCGAACRPVDCAPFGETWEGRLAQWQDYAASRQGAEHTVVGTVRVLSGVESAELGNRRDILVYLPPSYARGHDSYPVLYMQDGQNLFDQHTSYVGEWRVDEILEELATEGTEAIVVGVPNMTVARLYEYTPFREPRFGGGGAPAYLRFLVNTVKPLVDAEFRTARDRLHTGILGSSLGGLLSLYGLFEHPRTFGLVGAMSPSVMFADGALTTYLLGQPFVPARIALDVGTLEGPPANTGWLLSRLRTRPYVARVREARDLLEEMGYRRGYDLRYVEQRGGLHNEQHWSRRLPGVLRFLLGKKSESS